MERVNYLNILGVQARQLPCIKGEGAPSTQTEGAIGELYMDTTNGKLYKCTAENTWEEVVNLNLSPEDIGAAPEEHSHTSDEVSGLATVATSGSYNDLTDKPTISATITVDTAMSSTSENPVQNKVINAALESKSNTGHKHAASDITSGLATVATSGSYNDLSNKPTIPAAVTVDTAMSSTSTNPVQNKVVNTALDGKAPKSHATTATTYGAATDSNYGHVKLSDSTSSTSAASAGIAASPKAVKAAYDLANGKADADHTHDEYAASSHNQAASTITAGTFSATGIKAKTGTDYTTARIRNIKASTTDLTAGTSSLSSGDLYFVYE